jgi:AcrR family transcriptional regulator
LNDVQELSRTLFKKKVHAMDTAARRRNLKESLIDAAEQEIAAHGLGGLRARALAERIGCAVGAIYNVVADLDELVQLVNSRTLAALERDVLAAGRSDRAAGGGDNEPIERLRRKASAYLDFAVARRQSWRAVFDHRLPAGKPVPAWYLDDQMRLFGYVEGPLGELLPGMPPARRALLARSLFSAVHGIVTLGLEEKLQALAPDELREQVTFVVSALGRGLRESNG